MRKRVFSLLMIAAIAVAAIWWLAGHHQQSSSNQPAAQHQSNTTPTDTDTTPSFDKTKYSLTDPNSQWVIVNKHRPLDPKDFVPTLTVPNVKLETGPDAESMHVNTVMAPHLADLFTAAKQAGYSLMLNSGYRSYQFQIKVYNSEVKAYGKAHADAESARPGYSEHQTGLAADVGLSSAQCRNAACFGGLPAGKWLSANAYRYGFVIRYPQGKEAITGYEYEPWHIRYIGVAAATEMRKAGVLTLEQFFNLEPAPSYN